MSPHTPRHAREVVGAAQPMPRGEHRPCSGRELGAALAAPGGEDGAAGAGPHPGAEAVGLGPAAVVRLERALAHVTLRCVSSLDGSARSNPRIPVDNNCGGNDRGRTWFPRAVEHRPAPAAFGDSWVGVSRVSVTSPHHEHAKTAGRPTSAGYVSRCRAVKRGGAQHRRIAGVPSGSCRCPVGVGVRVPSVSVSVSLPCLRKPTMLTHRLVARRRDTPRPTPLFASDNEIFRPHACRVGSDLVSVSARPPGVTRLIRGAVRSGQRLVPPHRPQGVDNLVDDGDGAGGRRGPV